MASGCTCSCSVCRRQDENRVYSPHLGSQTCMQSGEVSQTPMKYNIFTLIQHFRQNVSNCLTKLCLYLKHHLIFFTRTLLLPFLYILFIRFIKGFTYSFVWCIEIQVHNISDAFLQHAVRVVWVHEPHEIRILQSVQQELDDTRLVLFSGHMHHIIPAALLQTHRNLFNRFWSKQLEKRHNFITVFDVTNGYILRYFTGK